MVKVKRVYEQSSEADGYRVLVDRIWPRGLKREQASVDEWAKDLAPSTDLRRWFSHRSERFEEFRTRYRSELGASQDRLDELAQRAAQGDLTLLFAARDPEHNNAQVLAEVLSERL